MKTKSLHSDSEIVMTALLEYMRNHGLNAGWVEDETRPPDHADYRIKIEIPDQPGKKQMASMVVYFPPYEILYGLDWTDTLGDRHNQYGGTINIYDPDSFPKVLAAIEELAAEL